MHIILRLPAVKQTTGLARSTIYKKISEKTFPSQIILGPRTVGWLDADIQQWLDQRINQSKS